MNVAVVERIVQRLSLLLDMITVQLGIQSGPLQCVDPVIWILDTAAGHLLGLMLIRSVLLLTP